MARTRITATSSDAHEGEERLIWIMNEERSVHRRYMSDE